MIASTGPSHTSRIGPGIPAVLGAVPGDTFRFQCWYRDSATYTGAGFNLSNGYEVRFEP